MARYRVIHWKDIPSLVEAYEGDEIVRLPLSQRFHDLIDAVAMRDGASETEAYLEGWGHSPEAEQPGSPREVAEAIAASLEAEFPDLVVRRFQGPPV